MKKEIGSEFCINSDNYFTGLQNGIDNHSISLLSGRTAIDLIIKDIQANRALDKVYIPSFCCSSMIKPFLLNGVEVVFYDVTINKDNGFDFDLPYPSKTDAVLIMDYFGFCSDKINDFLNTVGNDYLIVEDRTHSFFCNLPYGRSNYFFSSLRKWVGVSGIAIMYKRDGEVSLPYEPKINYEFIKLRKEASNLKKKYIDKGNIDKESYLNLYKKAEELIEDDYIGYIADDESKMIAKCLDVDEIVKKRFNNALAIINGLRDCKLVKTIHNNVTDKDCPLYVPIIVDENKRSVLHKYLISKNIYCPIHWPKSAFHKNLSQKAELLYKCELSIVCDQRYEVEDMERIIYEIRKFELFWTVKSLRKRKKI